MCQLYSQQSCPESGGAASPRSLEDDDDEDLDVKEKALQTEALLCALETLGKTWPRNPQTQGKLQLVLKTDTSGPLLGHYKLTGLKVIYLKPHYSSCEILCILKNMNARRGSFYHNLQYLTTKFQV